MLFPLPGKQLLFPQQCFHGWANRETFEETSRVTNVSATMFPSLPRALHAIPPSKLISLERRFSACLASLFLPNLMLADRGPEVGSLGPTQVLFWIWLVSRTWI